MEKKHEILNSNEQKLNEDIYYKAKKSLSELRLELKKQIILAITASFAFLIALFWQEPIKNTFILILEKIGLTGKNLLIGYISAILITIFSVIILLIIDRGIIKSALPESEDKKRE